DPTPSVIPDAAVQAHVAPDAAPPPPAIDAAVATVTFRVVTVPPGAELFREGEDIGPAPQAVLFVKENKDIKITAQLAGYEDAIFTLNPVERTNPDLKLTLKKLPPN